MLLCLQTSELLRTTLATDDTTISRICDKFKQKLFHESFDPSAGRCIDEVRADHWDKSIRDVVDSYSASSLASQCYRLWKDTRLEMLSLSAETRNLLKKLRSTYKLLLLTNGVEKVQREKVKAVGCEDFFDAIVIAGEHAEQKPFISIFRLCFSMLEVEAKDCVIVGDDLATDIQGGFNAGLQATVWINNTGSDNLTGSVKPDYTIPTVLDLPGVLAQLESGVNAF